MTDGNLPPRTETSGKAIASMVLGISSLLIPCVGLVTGILGVVFGAVARNDIQRMRLAGHDLQGNGMAIAGMVTGLVGIVLWIAVIVVVAVNGDSGPGYWDEYGN